MYPLGQVETHVKLYRYIPVIQDWQGEGLPVHVAQAVVSHSWHVFGPMLKLVSP